MDSDRKYRQNGYMDSSENKSFREGPKPQGPRPPLDVTGPRLPRLVQHVAASRCFNCATTLPPETDLTGNCPKCNAGKERCSTTGQNTSRQSSNADRSHEGRKTDPAATVVSWDYQRGLTGIPKASANNRSEPAYASNTYVPRNGHGLHALPRTYPKELHFIRLPQGRVRGSSK